MNELEEAYQSVESRLEQNRKASDLMSTEFQNAKRELSQVNNSSAWRIALFIKRFGSKLFPSTSWQYNTLHNFIDKARKLKDKRQFSKDISMIQKSSYFNKDWYLETYVDVKKAHMNPAMHYIQFGGFEGRNPSEKFDSNWYYQKYSDVFLSGMNPLVHYLRYGMLEGREIRNAQPKIENATLKGPQPELLRSLERINSEDDILNYASMLLGISQQEIREKKKVPTWHLHREQVKIDNNNLEKLKNQTGPLIQFTFIMILDCQPVHLVNRAIQSVIMQTHPGWSLHVYINCQRNWNAEVLKLAFERYQEKIKFIPFKSAREITVDLSSLLLENNDYYIFLNSFDELKNDCLLKVAEKIRKSFPDIIYTQLSKDILTTTSEATTNLILDTDIPTMQLIVIKKEALAKVNPSSHESVYGIMYGLLNQGDRIRIQEIDPKHYFPRAIPGRSFIGFIFNKDHLNFVECLIPINVVIDARLINRKTTGTERYIRELLKGLSKIKSEFGIRLKAISFTDPTEVIEGVEFVTSDHLSTVLNSDIFHKTFPASDNVTLCEMALAPSLVFSPLDLIAFNNPDYYPEELDYFQYRSKLKSAAMISDKVIAISEHGKNEIVSFLGVPEEKVDAIYLGVNQDIFTTSNENSNAYFSKLSIPDKYFLFIGTDYPHKNLITALKALRIVSDEIPDVFLVIAGAKYYVKPQPELTNLMDLLKDRVVQLGHVPDEILPALYRNARSLLFPSLYEGFGLPVLEAMLCGTPVVSSSCTSLPEVGGDAALFFDGNDVQILASEMKNVWKDEKIRSRLIEAGQKNVLRFTWEATAKKTALLYKRAIQKATDLTYDERIVSVINGLQQPSFRKPTIFFITHVRFYPPSAGNEQRIFKFINYLRKLGYQIVVLVNPFLESEPLEDKQRAKTHQFVDFYEEISDPSPIVDNNNPNSIITSNVISRWSDVERSFCPDRLMERVRQLVEIFSPEVVVAEYIWTSRILDLIPDATLRIIDLIDLFSQKKDRVIKFGIKDDLAISEEERGSVY